MRPVLRVILFLLFLEAFLRAGGAWASFWQDRLNWQGLGKGEYRIMCVGDSMTYEGGAGSYPAQLESALKERYPSLAVRVINKGLPGGEVNGLTAQLPGWLKEYSPDMVLVMIGLLDAPDKGTKTTLAGWLDKELTAVHVYKLGKRLVKGIREHFQGAMPARPAPAAAPGTPSDKPSPQVMTVIGKLFLMGVSAEESKNYDEAERIFTDLEQAPVEEDTKDLMRRHLVPILRAQKHYGPLTALLARHVDCPWVGDVIEDMCKQREASEQLQGALKELAESSADPIPYETLGACLSVEKEEVLAEKYLSKARALRNSGDYENMHQRLIMIGRAVREINGRLVLVQYPLRDPDIYRHAVRGFDDMTDVLIVDNRQAFRRALAEGAYETFFRDRIAGDFGHCTVQGNHILAGNIALTIGPVIPRKYLQP